MRWDAPKHLREVDTILPTAKKKADLQVIERADSDRSRNDQKRHCSFHLGDHWSWSRVSPAIMKVG